MQGRSNRHALITVFIATCGVLRAAHADVAIFAGPSSASVINPVNGLTNHGVAIGNVAGQSGSGAYRWDTQTITPLNRPAGQVFQPYASAINEAEIVAGSNDSQTSPLTVPMAWTSASGSTGSFLSRTAETGTYLNTTFGDTSYIAAINQAGVITGSMLKRGANNSFDGRVVVRWSDTTAAPVALQGLQLGSAAPLGLSFPSAQNDAGTVVGFSLRHDNSSRRDGPRVALRWAPNSTVSDQLDDLPHTLAFADRDTRIQAINRGGVSVGASGYDTYNSSTSFWTMQKMRPARWDAGTTVATPLDMLAQKSDGSGLAFANQINDAGTTVGTSDKYGANDAYMGTFAVRWAAGGTAVTELGTLGPRTDETFSGDTTAINASGVTVGRCQTAIAGVNQYRATMWLPDQTAAIDLNTILGAASDHWSLMSADRVSDTGFVAGTARYDDDGAAGPLGSYYRYYSMLIPQAGTYIAGDADFDTLTNFNDLVILAQHYNQTNPTQNINVADFDLNGVTDFNDLVTLAQNYTSGGSSLAGAADESFDPDFASDWALAQSLVPEPASAVVIAGIAIGSCRQRRMV